MCSRRKLSEDKVSMKKSWLLSLLLKCSEGKLKRTKKGVEDIVNPSVGVQILKDRFTRQLVMTTFLARLWSIRTSELSGK